MIGDVWKIVPNQNNFIKDLKIFTYPTRLADAWIAEILEINIPAHEIQLPDIEIRTYQGSTEELNIQPRNPLKKIYKKYAEAIQMDGEYIFDARYETDKNIAHILKNIAPGLLVAKHIPPNLPNITVILNANATRMAKKVYKLLGFQVLCTDKNVTGTIISAPTGKDGLYACLYPKLFGGLAFEGYQEATPKRVFISRKGKSRNLINEAEVGQALSKYGFKKIYYEDITLSEQWSISKNAKVVVAVHGAAIASLGFNCNSVKLVELFHPGYVTKAYRRMICAIGGSWCAVTGKIPPNLIGKLDYKQKSGRYFALSSFEINLQSLYRALEHLGIS